MIQFVWQYPGREEYVGAILNGEYYIVGTMINFYSNTGIWNVAVSPGPAVGTQYWIRIDGVDYKVEPADTVESYLNRIRVPLHNAIMNDTLDELD